MHIESKQRLGLVMTVATLMVIFLSSYLLLRGDLKQQLSAIQVNGANFTRVLSNIPYRKLAPENLSEGILQLSKVHLSNSGLAYIAVVDVEGRLVNKISAADIEPPEATHFDGTSLSPSEHYLKLGDEGLEILEFRVALLEEGKVAGYMRTGYYLPRFNFEKEQLALIAEIVFPLIFLMMFLYVMLRRQISPVDEANAYIRELINDQEESRHGGDKGDKSSNFNENLNYFISLTQDRLKALESENTEAKTSSNLLAYHKRQVESVLQTMPDAVVVIDESGLATFANQKLESLTGISIESIMGKPPQEWRLDENVVTLLSRYHGNVTPLHRMELVNYCPEDYPDRNIEVSVLPLFPPKNISVVLGTVVILSSARGGLIITILTTQERFMSKIISFFVASLILVISAQSYADSDDPNLGLIKARQGNMELRSFFLGPLAAMAEGEMPYDAEMAASLASNLKLVVDLDIGRAWEKGTDSGKYPGKTDALEKIWSTYPEVAEHGKKSKAAVEVLAGSAGNGLDALRADLGPVGKSCKGCHDDFKEE